MIKHKGLIAVLGFLANLAGIAITKQMIAPNSIAWWAIGLVGAVCTNLCIVFAAPLATSKASDADRTPVTPPIPKGSIPLQIMLILGIGGIVAAVMFFGCAGTPKKIAVDFAACSAGKVPSDVQPLLPAVESALMGQGADWQSSLEQVGITAGADLLECAVLAVYKNLLDRVPTHGQPSQQLLVAIDRADQWLKAHK